MRTSRKNLSGQRFGRLSVLRPTDARKNGEVVWECLCDCGKTAMVIGSVLKRGGTQSCGCLRKEETAKRSSTKAINLTGQRFGRLSVLRPTDARKNGEVVWECLCDCGKTAMVIGSVLKRGRTQSCGCLRKEETAKRSSMNAINLTGQRFGRLTAVRTTDERKNGSLVWECKCDCGNTVFVQANDLSSNHTQSCGCLQKDAIRNTGKQRAVDITGQKFGLLTAVRPTENRKNSYVIWECVCDCGCTTFSTTTALKHGKKKSCGCLRNMSKHNQNKPPF